MNIKSGDFFFCKSEKISLFNRCDWIPIFSSLVKKFQLNLWNMKLEFGFVVNSIDLLLINSHSCSNMMQVNILKNQTFNSSAILRRVFLIFCIWCKLKICQMPWTKIDIYVMWLIWVIDIFSVAKSLLNHDESMKITVFLILLWRSIFAQQNNE